jgi:dethiobiotin synthetase
MRPARLIAVVGTHTEVGKTWVSESLLRQWRARRLRVAARKPVQSFEPGSGPTDAERLAAATGEHAHRICAAHRWYPRAMAPPMAADVLTRPRITLDDLFAELTWPGGIDFGLVETVGGVCSPLAHDGASIDFVRRLEPDEVLLVADAGLGVINAVKLAMQCLDATRTRVLLNRFDPANPLHRLNAEWLTRNEKVAAFSSVAELL